MQALWVHQVSIPVSHMIYMIGLDTARMSPYEGINMT